MRTLICCELATAHGGDVALAADMIRAAADAGADYAKLQSYSRERINPADPQADWLRQARLSESAHARLLDVARGAGIGLMSTPFDADSLHMLLRVGVYHLKIASSEADNEWWSDALEDKSAAVVVSWPWGMKGHVPFGVSVTHHLTAIPLYPTPLEAVGRATLLDGYSDHAEGIEACQWALAQGAKMLEVHVCMPERSRVTKFDKTFAQVRQLREFADQMTTLRGGVGQVFRERWRRA